MIDAALQDILDDLAVRSKSPESREEYERWERDQRRSDIEGLIEAAGIPKMYMTKNFDNFRKTRNNRLALRITQEYVQSWNESTSQGLTLFGDVGVGKSHLAAAVVRGLIEKNKINAVYANALITFEMARMSIGGRGLDPIPTLIRAPFLALDDLGSERPSRWTLEKLTLIVESRVSEGLPIMITSNSKTWAGLAKTLLSGVQSDYDSAEIVTVVTRIIDRLQGATSAPVVMVGKSWRKPKEGS